MSLHSSDRYAKARKKTHPTGEEGKNTEQVNDAGSGYTRTQTHTELSAELGKDGNAG